VVGTTRSLSAPCPAPPEGRPVLPPGVTLPLTTGAVVALAFVADWPTTGVAETAATAAADELIAAAAHARQLWPVEPGAGVGGGGFGGGWATAAAVAKPDEPGERRPS